MDTLPPRTLNLSNTPPLNLTGLASNQAGFNQPNANVSQGTDAFNTAVMGLLTKYQSLGTKPYKTQELDAQQEQQNRISAPTPQNLVGAAPGVQDSVRSNSAQAISPTIQSAQNSQQTFGEQLNSFGNAITSAQNFMQTYKQSQDQLKSDAVNTINNVISQGGSEGLKSLLSSQPDLFKVAGLDVNTYQNGVLPHIQSQEKTAQDKATQASQFSLSPGQTQYDASGQQIAQAPDKASSSSPKIIGSASSGYYTVDAQGNATPLTTGGVQNASAFPTVALQPGQSGAQVSQLQNALGIPTTGTYDQATTQAVLALQQQLGIDYSSGPGYFGPKTMAALQGTQVKSAPKAAASSVLPSSKPVTSGSLKYTSSDISQGQQKLESSRGTDGYSDPSVYLQMYQTWVNAGGLLQDFLTKYPAKNYVNPANSWLPSYLMPGGKAATSRTA